MFSFARRFRHVATGALLAAFVSLPVVAEDSEIYVSTGTTKEAQPNVLFVIDTSGSMGRQVGSTGLTRIDTVRNVALGLARRLRNVNLGLMRYNTDPAGGLVLQPVADIENQTHRDMIISTLDGLNTSTIGGFTPLSETYYEAMLYMTGGAVDYGTNSIATSRRAGDQTLYQSPMTHQCQKNYIVYLTDGLPTQDVGANAPNRIPRVAGIPAASCSTDENSDAAQGECTDELAGFLSAEDRDLSTAVAGNQNILTYMIGFGPEVEPVPSFNLDTVAAAGGTEHAYTATDAPSLTTTLEDIFKNLQTDRGTFVTPTVSVDAFNRAQTSSDLFFSLFRATDRLHWGGNLKKYQIVDGVIVDGTGAPAVAGGFFSTGAQSIWSATIDGNDIEAGGAASRLNGPDTRKIYTSLVNSNLADPANALVVDDGDVDGPNGPFSDLIVGTGVAADSCSDACKEAIRWARGDDLTTPAVGDFVRKFGDPLHGQPAIVTYGNYNPDSDEPDTYVFMPTNDGLLHAFDGRTDPAGTKELWAYIPTELLPRLGPLRTNSPTASRTFGLDGDVRVLRLDKNNNGKIEYNADARLSDRVWLFFGMRSGGSHYYALDVTRPASPQLLWSIGPDELPGVGLSWSPPVVTRVNVSGSNGNDDDEKFVLVFGGGYDYAQETQTYSTDPTGNRIFMVDAKSGDLLWSAGGYDTNSPPATLPNLVLNTAGRAMDNAIPGRITVIDHNGDQFADRMYAGDMGGRVWRFDILNNNDASALVRGGVFAMLGNGGAGSPTAANNRRLYNAPDVALFQRRGEPSYYNIAIGSGYRGHPLNRDTVERFYSLRDPDPFDVYSQDVYDTRTNIIVDDATLEDVSTNPAGSTVSTASRGWKYTLNRNGGGEKVLAESITVGGVILFPTYEPVAPGGANPCAPTSINRAYALTAFAGKPAINFLNDTGNEALTNADVFTALNQQGIVGAINVALLRNPDDEEGGEAPRTVCLAGVEILSRCVDVGGTVRTYWQRNDVP